MFTRVFALLPLALLASATRLTARDTGDKCEVKLCCNNPFNWERTFPVYPGIDINEEIDRAAASSGCSEVSSFSSCQKPQPVCCTFDNSLIGATTVKCAPGTGTDTAP